MRQLLLTAFLFLSFTSAAYSQCTQSPGVRRTIEAINKKFTEAFNGGDAAGVAGMYKSDALLMPPNSPIIGNHLGIQTFWQQLITAGIKVVSLKTSSLDACGNTAIETGQYELTIPKAGGGTTTDYGKYIVVWKRQGKNWKLTRDIWNTNMAAGG